MPGPGAGDAGDAGGLRLPATPAPYAAPELPGHFVSTGLGVGETNLFFPIRERISADNPITDEGATLGRVLFYDVRLSRNESVSCGSCHRPEHGFSDERVLSEGFEGGLTRRHSMGLTNARYTGAGRYFWDERAPTLEEQVLMPVQDEVEMGMDLDELTRRLAAAPEYPPLFEAAFGDDEVTAERVAFALAQFVRCLLSYRAPYDVGRAQVQAATVDFPNLSDEENLGKRLFLTRRFDGGLNCVACHDGEAFTAPLPTSNGLDLETTDRGVGGARDDPAFDAMFRVPSLRNVAVRAPYMHDGRFADLDEVLEHYSEGVQGHPALTIYVDVAGAPAPLHLSEAEKAAVVAFLGTLTDRAMLEDEKLQDPFVP